MSRVIICRIVKISYRVSTIMVNNQLTIEIILHICQYIKGLSTSLTK